MRNELPLVSVIVVNYNGEIYIRHCVEAVLVNKYANFEVIIVDNGSRDGSILFLKDVERKNNNVRGVLLDRNYGPAYARNRGVEQAKGKYLAFLDNDTIPDENWLTPLVDVMEKDSTIGACQCKLLLLKEPDRFDYAGDYLGQFGFLVQRVNGGEKDLGQVDKRAEILSAKSAAMIIKRSVFDEIKGFDEDYFIYLEETDLGWRTWLAGYRIIFVPESRVYHEFGTTSVIDPRLQNYNAKFHGAKNYVMTLAKNLGTLQFAKVLPLHLFLWGGICICLVLRGASYEAWLVLKGIGWDFVHFPVIMKKRFLIQHTRKISDKELLPKIVRIKQFTYFYNKFAISREIGHAKSW